MSVYEIEPQIFDKFRLQPFDKANSSAENRECIDLINDISTTMLVSTTQVLKTVSHISGDQHIHYGQRKSFSITIDKIKPVRSWKAAKHGTTSRFAGLLVKSIPDLARISVDKLDHTYDQFRNRE